MGGIPNSRIIIFERREKVIVMLSKGLNETEIAQQLNVNQSTVCRDIKRIKKESQEVIQSVLEDLLPYEIARCQTTIEQIIKESWNIFHDKSDKWNNKDKINAMKLVKEAIRTKFEIIIQGPTNLYLQQLQNKVIQLNKEIEEEKNDYTAPIDMLLRDDNKNSGI